MINKIILFGFSAMKLKHLFESQSVARMFDSVSITRPVSEYQKPTPYDWFIEYLISSLCSYAVSSAYENWKGSTTKNKFPLAFIYQWKAEMYDTDYYKSPLAKASDDYHDLVETLDQSLHMNADGSFDVSFDIDLAHCDLYSNSEDGWFSAAPPKINNMNGEFYLENSNLTMDDWPEWLPNSFNRKLSFDHCIKLTSLHNIHKAVKHAYWISLSFSGVKSHVLGLLQIPGLKKVEFRDNPKLEEIINKYLPEGDLLDCQEELIDAGLGEYAKL